LLRDNHDPTRRLRIFNRRMAFPTSIGGADLAKSDRETLRRKAIAFLDKPL
jgi:hypothetical protein